VIFVLRERRRVRIDRLELDVHYSFRDVVLTGKLTAALFALSGAFSTGLIRPMPSWRTWTGPISLCRARFACGRCSCSSKRVLRVTKGRNFASSRPLDRQRRHERQDQRIVNNLLGGVHAISKSETIISEPQKRATPPSSVHRLRSRSAQPAPRLARTAAAGGDTGGGGASGAIELDPVQLQSPSAKTATRLLTVDADANGTGRAAQSCPAIGSSRTL
jgi:hypothetical protein